MDIPADAPEFSAPGPLLVACPCLAEDRTSPAMYDLHDYARMIADEARMGPYVQALQAVVTPGSVVADVGSGTGIFALVACRLGARRVYAIETGDVIQVGRELARENGVADRIVFFHGDSREVELPERADVIVSDLRGVLPLYREHLAIVADFRTRFLKPGGVLIPARDRLMVAVVERPDLYEWAVGPAHGPIGVTLESMRARLRNATFADRECDRLRPECVVTTAAAWATLDYATVQPLPIAGCAELRVQHQAIGHGLALWFEADVTGECGFSSASAQLNCYGRLFLPWPRPLALSKGDQVDVDLWAQADGEPWGWNSTVTAVDGARAAFKQSSFLSMPSKPVASVRDARSATLSQETGS